MEVALSLMTREEARTCVQKIRTHVQSTRALLFDLHERQGWRALGYDSWKRCLTDEFELSTQRAWQMVSAYRVDQVLGKSLASTIVDACNGVAELPETHARELASLIDDEDALRAVYAEVQVATSGKPTIAAYRAAVRRHLGSDTSQPCATQPETASSSPIDGVDRQALPPVLDPSRLLPGQQEKARYTRAVQSLRARLFDIVRAYPSKAGVASVAEEVESDDFDLSVDDCRRLLAALAEAERGRRALLHALHSKRPRRSRKGRSDGSTT